MSDDPAPIVAVLPGDGWYVASATKDGRVNIYQPSHRTVDADGEVRWWFVDWDGYANDFGACVNFLGAFEAAHENPAEAHAYYAEKARRYAYREGR